MLILMSNSFSLSLYLQLCVMDCARMEEPVFCPTTAFASKDSPGGDVRQVGSHSLTHSISCLTFPVSKAAQGKLLPESTKMDGKQK